MRKDTRLDARQIRILEDYFGRSVAGETMEQIAKDNGISRKTLWTWKETAHGKELHAQYQKEMSTNDIPTFYRVLSENVAKGSFKHMELFAKIHGMLAPTKQEIVTEERQVGGQEITKESMEDIKERIKLYKNQQNNVVNFNRVADNDR